MIAEEETVHKQFPTALVNRLEKHRVFMDTVLDARLHTLLEKFKQWISDFKGR